ncbi:hypothetical protein [Erythrobacter sp. F6033]|uniref:hypothetical protein n=1 Tax=Erythrobacter sp. F6033 TaxID=2926401 RepID=UPI001FF35DA1|nr:hypothetical protein [Erythrobacter sp. F6033]MCK0129480.1 hypothetical protein [Erythrobacter sp. F6033]
MRALAVIALAATVTACTTPSGSWSVRPGMPLIAADNLQNRLAQDEGVIAALTKTAAPGAVIFAPGPVDALKWLGEQERFPQSQWQGHLVAVSCDGSLGAVTGAIQWGEYPGYYTTIWRYENAAENQRGEWRWIVSHGDALENPRPAPQRALTQVASCKDIPEPAGMIGQAGQSADGSLRYNWTYTVDDGRTLTVEIWDGSRFKAVIADKVAAGQAE